MPALPGLRSAELFAAWEKWCAAEGEDHGTQTAFTLTLKKLGYDTVKDKGGAKWRGIDLAAGRSQRSFASRSFCCSVRVHERSAKGTRHGRVPVPSSVTVRHPLPCPPDRCRWAAGEPGKTDGDGFDGSTASLPTRVGGQPIDPSNPSPQPPEEARADHRSPPQPPQPGGDAVVSGDESGPSQDDGGKVPSYPASLKGDKFGSGKPCLQTPWPEGTTGDEAQH